MRLKHAQRRLERIMIGWKRFGFPSNHVNPLYTYELEQIHRV